MLYTYVSIYLIATIKKKDFYLSFINLVKPKIITETFFVNNQISYLFPLRRFLNLMNFELIILMSINFKLINFMWMNFVNKQISYLLPLRCFLNLINFMSINFKLINFMSMSFVQISYFFPLRCFLMLFNAYKILSWKSYFFPLRCFLMLFGAFFCFLVLFCTCEILS